MPRLVPELSWPRFHDRLERTARSDANGHLLDARQRDWVLGDKGGLCGREDGGIRQGVDSGKANLSDHDLQRIPREHDARVGLLVESHLFLLTP